MFSDMNTHTHTHTNTYIHMHTCTNANKNIALPAHLYILSFYATLHPPSSLCSIHKLYQLIFKRSVGNANIDHCAAVIVGKVEALTHLAIKDMRKRGRINITFLKGKHCRTNILILPNKLLLIHLLNATSIPCRAQLQIVQHQSSSLWAYGAASPPDG